MLAWQHYPVTRLEVSEQIRRIGILPSVLASSVDEAVFAAYELSQSGVPIIELTVNDAITLGAIEELRKRGDGVIVGAGEVAHVEIARQCVNAGAMFVTGPNLDRDTIEYAHSKDIAVLPGALTPTEVMNAWRAGGDFVKVFPCANLGGPRYIRALRGPYPDTPIIASGGVNAETVADFIRAGADAVGIGKALVPQDAIQLRQASRIRTLAHRFRGLIEQGRADVAAVRVADAKK
jgi:2-dehydro-3-deoxyphosphogluconate aldolase / (4S)-4-hydroxy-2-oxoglutarate aldolase